MPKIIALAWSDPSLTLLSSMSKRESAMTVTRAPPVLLAG